AKAGTCLMPDSHIRSVNPYRGIIWLLDGLLPSPGHRVPVKSVRAEPFAGSRYSPEPVPGSGALAAVSNEAKVDQRDHGGADPNGDQGVIGVEFAWLIGRGWAGFAGNLTSAGRVK